MPSSRSKPLVAIAAIAMLLGMRIASGADAERGRALYELRCGACHSESVHGRVKRVATDFGDVRRWVTRWNEHLALRWDDEEIDDVAVYLNDTYYRYRCPPQVCKVVSLASGALARRRNTE
jgi:mono/diheme cytochrome c family protein